MPNIKANSIYLKRLAGELGRDLLPKHGEGFKGSRTPRACPACEGTPHGQAWLCPLCKGEQLVTQFAAVAYAEAKRDYAQRRLDKAQAAVTRAIFGGRG